jgi:hypothetical protein
VPMGLLGISLGIRSYRGWMRPHVTSLPARVPNNPESMSFRQMVIDNAAEREKNRREYEDQQIQQVVDSHPVDSTGVTYGAVGDNVVVVMKRSVFEEQQAKRNQD